ncbi:SDR family oxidoreductase [Streptomyces californicus]|uniref:SDR family oxidoreductase n=1 Tax=Streptomyces californicus TaxID=67351 RepID=UPI00296F3FCC|nr:sugar nucleotide-binding protein [Streptomyces californicus]MDW4918763.1 sugar nucleotide-binding protein [Streptomyces californicus]
MTLLIVGGTGFLGRELIRQAVSAGHSPVATWSRRPGGRGLATWRELDLRDRGQIRNLLEQVRPRMVVNASSGGADWQVTAEGPIHLALAAAKHGCRLIHVSSDAVFSGIGRSLYDEACAPDPITPYGAAKAAAEAGVLAVHPEAVVARTSLIIGYGRSEHERLVHDLAYGTRAGALLTDDLRCPVHVSDLASALLELASGDDTGVRHLGGPDAVSRHALGLLIARRDGLDPSRLPSGRADEIGFRGALDVRLDSRVTQNSLTTNLRGPSRFLSQG